MATERMCTWNSSIVLFNHLIMCHPLLHVLCAIHASNSSLRPIPLRLASTPSLL